MKDLGISFGAGETAGWARERLRRKGHQQTRVGHLKNLGFGFATGERTGRGQGTAKKGQVARRQEQGT